MKRFQQADYQEQLSSVAERLSQTRATLGDIAAGDPGLVDFGYQLGNGTLVIYWSGSADSPILAQMRDAAASAGTKVLIAPRRVSNAQLLQATDSLEQHREDYRKAGIALSAFGGFSSDFDGLEVSVDPEQSAVKDSAVIAEKLQNDLGLPVKVTMARVNNTVGRYADSSPFNGGGLMVSSQTGNPICTSGFGVVKGATQYRYLSARHCVNGPYHTVSGGLNMGSISLAGTGYNGAAIFSAGGTYWDFSGVLGDDTSYRTLTQRDPSLSTVGTSVCQEGANSGQKCGLIRQVALDFDDGQGGLLPIRVNYVTAPDGSYIVAGGDSGGPVISLHTQARAWAVGIEQGAFGNPIYTCTLYAPHNDCYNNFVFTNLDYAMYEFTDYAVRYG